VQNVHIIKNTIVLVSQDTRIKLLFASHQGFVFVYDAELQFILHLL